MYLEYIQFETSVSKSKMHKIQILNSPWSGKTGCTESKRPVPTSPDPQPLAEILY